MSINKREYRDENGRVYKTRYRVRWAVRDLAGKRRFRSREFRTQTEARDFEAQVRLELSASVDARRTGRSARGVTLHALWEEYVADKERNRDLEPSTIRGYRSIWNAHLADAVGNLTLAECDGTSRARDRALGYYKQRRNVGVATQRKALVVLSSILSYARDYGLISDHNTTPKRGTLGSRASQRSARMISIADVELMRQAIMERTAGSSIGYSAQERNLRDALFLTLLAYAGLRPAEAMGLKIADVSDLGDAEKTVIAVRRQVADGVEKDVKNARAADQAAIRDLDQLPRPLIVDLRNWLAVSKRTSPDDFLFHRADGGPWTKTLYKRWCSLAFKVGLNAAIAHGNESLTGARPYDLRHSLCLTFALLHDVDPLTAARRAGHTTAVAYEWYVTARRNPDALRLSGISTWPEWALAVNRYRLAQGPISEAM